MLAETLREWDEQKIAEGRREGRLAGRREGRRRGRQEGRREGRLVGRQEGRREVLAEERALLCSQAGRRFGAATGVEDASELARVGALIIDCDSGQDFLARARLR